MKNLKVLFILHTPPFCLNNMFFFVFVQSLIGAIQILAEMARNVWIWRMTFIVAAMTDFLVEHVKVTDSLSFFHLIFHSFSSKRARQL